MEILKQRTRLLISDYTDREKLKLEDYVARMDNVYLYYDQDKGVIGIPPGFENTLKEKFPNAIFKDDTNSYWAYNTIQPVNHSAEPRNQLQKDFISFAIEHLTKGEKIAGILGCGSGKEQPYSERIPTPNGWSTMGELKVGDYVFGAHGEPQKISQIYEQGEKDVYEITFNNGCKVRCGLEHLWYVKTSYNGKYHPVTLGEMLKDFKKFDKSKLKNKRVKDPYEYKYYIPKLSAPVEYNYREIPIDPYTLGVFIGNGCCRENILTLSSGNYEIPKNIAVINKFIVKKSKAKNYSYMFYDKYDNPIHTKDFFEKIPEMINCYSKDKIIPDDYIYNSYDVRLGLLQGLMDTDGTINKTGDRFHVSYSSTSKKLLEQILEIIRSLGWDGSIYEDKRTDHYTNGYCGSLVIKIPHNEKYKLFTLSSKRDIASKLIDYGRNNFRDHLLIKDIKLVGKENSRCLYIDSPEHLYLTDDFIVTHNTFMTCYIAIKMGMKTLIVVPTSSIKVQWGETLTNMFKVNPSRVKVINSPREFINCNADFVVVSHASLATLNKNYDLEKVLKNNKFGLCCIDECQMFFKNIIMIESSSNIRNTIVLTGTFGRSDETENNLYQTMFNDIKIFREQMKTPTFWDRRPGNIYGQRPYHQTRIIWTSSGLTGEQIKAINTSKVYSEREAMWIRYGINVGQYMNLVIPPDGRMTKFLQTLLKVVQMGEKECTYGSSLILLPTIRTCKIMIEHLKGIFPNKKIGTINSLQSKSENQRNKIESDIIVATPSSCGTGFDKPMLSKTYMFTPMKSWIQSEQIFYRTRRRADEKDVYFYDVIDKASTQLKNWGNARVEIYRPKSIKLKVISM